MNFPLHAIREYTEIFKEREYSVIQTAKNRYVLDIDNTGISSYAKRRLEILRKPHPKYKIYPLNVRVDSWSQLINSKKKKFIDSTGKLVNYKPSISRNVVTRRITERWRTNDGYWMITVDKCPSKFKVLNGTTKYAQIIEVSKLRQYLYDVTDVPCKPFRRKV